jgi:hypothetical protein
VSRCVLRGFGFFAYPLAVNGQMAIRDFAGAQIQLLLASNNPSQVQQIKHDLQRSSYLYAFTLLGERNAILKAIQRQVEAGASNLPTVLVLNYEFVKRDCEKILRLIQKASAKMAVECVITHPPMDQAARLALTKMGARLFDALEPSEFALQ